MEQSGVFILGISDCGEKMCAAGGRISTQSGNALGIWAKSQDAEKNANLIDKVTRSGHNSTVEHIFFNLAFSDVSVQVEQFMIEFRLASFTVKSRRYVDFSDAGFYTPAFKSAENRAKYEAHVRSLFEAYSKLIDNGVPKEDARFVLPYCFLSNFFCSLNGRELLHVLKAMLYGRGAEMPEIYALGQSLRAQAEKLAPGLFAGFDERKPNASDRPDFGFMEAIEKKSREKELVELLGKTENAEQIVVTAALLEENRFTAEQIQQAVIDPETAEKIIKAVLATTRPRALEAVSYTFALNGVSLSTLTHFARHRMHSLLVPNLNTVDRASYIVPENVKKDSETLQAYVNAFEHNIHLYECMKADGEAEALPYLLLSGNTVDLVSTMNGRELLLFMKLRSCTRAQWEIQLYANAMLAVLRSEANGIFRHYGPSCYVTGVCPEGRLSCGKAVEMKEKFKA